MKRTKQKKEGDEEVKLTPVEQLKDTVPMRDAKGQFVAGHVKLGGTKVGNRWKFSGEIRDKIGNLLMQEIGSDKFVSGLNDLFYSDSRSYYQVICLLAKIVVPNNLEIDAKISHKTTIDERLAILVGKKKATEEE